MVMMTRCVIINFKMIMMKIMKMINKIIVVIINIKYFPLCTTAYLQEDETSRSTERNHEKTTSILPPHFLCLSYKPLVGNDLEKE